MAELPRGTTREVRRGGSGVLELLLIDFDKEGGDGYIRVERPTSVPSTSQLVVQRGKPSLALHECEILLMGQAALDALRIDAAAADSRLSIHVDVDLALISGLHPEARLHLDEEDFVTGQKVSGWIVDPSEESSWWQQKRRTEWKQSETTLEAEVEEAPAELEAVLVHNPGEELEVGYAYLVDDADPDSSLAVASHLAAIGHPLLVLSRTPPERLAQEHRLPESVCRWLSEMTDTEVATVNPGLESVRKEIDDFLWAATRAVIVVDGLEYLSGLHGFDRLLGMLRDLFDSIQSSEDVVLMSADLDAWDERERSLLLRECDLIPAGRMMEWAERPAVIEGHPFCQDYEEISIPAPRTIDVEADAKEEFKAAAGRLLTAKEDVVREPEGGPKLEPALDGFSVEALIDEMRREDSEKSVDDRPEADDLGIPEEELVTGHAATAEASSSDEDAPLPDWATAPSANMGDEPGQFVGEPAVVDLGESVPIEGKKIQVEAEVSVPGSGSASASESVSGPESGSGSDSASVSASAPVSASGSGSGFDSALESESVSTPDVEISVEIPSGPKAATVNHRVSAEKKISVAPPLSSHQMASAALQKSVEESREISTELSNPGYEALGLAHSSMNEAGDRSRVVGDWVTDEERDWEALQMSEMQSAVDNARGIRHTIPSEEGATPARLNVRSWSAAAGAAAETKRRAKAPDDPDNPLARNPATRAQKVRTLTQYVVGSEMDALYSDRRHILNQAGIDLEVLGRVTELSEKGHPIQPLVERLEADSGEGMQLLKKMEKDSKKVAALLNRLNVFEENGVVDSVVGERYRKRLLEFKEMDEIETLLTDLEG